VTVLWALTVLAPIATVLATGLAGLAPDAAAARMRSALFRYAAVALVPALVLALVGPAAGTLELPWLLLGTSLEVGAVGRPLLLVAVLLYAAGLVAVASNPPARAPALVAFLLVCFVGNVGVFLAADAVTFYLSFALMSFAGYGLVVHDGTDTARRAGRVYLVLTVLSETAILAGLLLVVDAGGLMIADAPAAVAASPRAGLIIGLLMAGFAVKAGTVPLHVWLPLAHPAAPPPASAVLSGTMIKAGLVGWLAFLPLGEAAYVGWGTLLVVLALLGAFLAVPAGLLQADTKVALAYSSVSQMGFLAVVVGAALATPELAEASVVAAVLYAVHHGLAKGALFLGVPVWRRHGAGRLLRWWVGVGLVGACLAVAGAPFSSGAVAKYAAKEAVEGVSVVGLDLVLLLPLVATGSTLLLARYAWLLMRGESESRGVDGELAAWSVLVGTGIVVAWVLAGRWLPVTSVPGLEPVTLWEAAWPVLLGLVLTGVGLWLSSRDLLPGWAAHPNGRFLPPGDLVVPEESFVRRAGRGLEPAVGWMTRLADGARSSAARRARAFGGVAVAAGRGETRLDRWEVSGLVVLGLLVVLVGVGVVAGGLR
jgi:formate hydrogenlyase subunit 3/multisubunit Na+/H+ antiporter MnhD subunit